VQSGFGGRIVNDRHRLRIAEHRKLIDIGSPDRADSGFPPDDRGPSDCFLLCSTGYAQAATVAYGSAATKRGRYWGRRAMSEEHGVADPGDAADRTVAGRR